MNRGTLRYFRNVSNFAVKNFDLAPVSQAHSLAENVEAKIGSLSSALAAPY